MALTLLLVGIFVVSFLVNFWVAVRLERWKGR